jgi:pimeloyl-ACP methyl ester carboxylesterase
MVTLPPSRWADLDGPVHYVDFGGPDDGPLVVCVHGLGGSHANWVGVAPQLARTCRVFALDLAGFGLTRAQGRSTSVPANTSLVHRFMTEVAPTLDGVRPGPPVLVGNSMGGLIVALEAADHPRDVAAAVLLDPAMPLYVSSRPDPLVLAAFAAYLAPGLGSLVLRGRRTVRTPEQVAMDILRLCCADPHRVPADVFQAHIDLARRREAYTEMDAEFLAATRSLLWVLNGRRRLLHKLTSIRCPVLLIHGDADRLIPVGTARRVAALNPTWRFEVAQWIGHVPMLEAPDFVLGVLEPWLAGLPSETGTSKDVSA